ncbi:MAG: thiamine diphosphokinase [Thermosipho sp. (in: Bacteria)]|nr:thiamine diphosphokinase [Thermosipho sp. (in: thermotogales)]
MKATIVLNGNTNNLHIPINDLIIAVDGGANLLRKNNIIPNVIIGDLDSIDDETLNYFKERKVKIIKFPKEKDKTDSELAIIYAMENGADEIKIINYNGERLDMILALFGLMKKYNLNIKAISEKLEIGIIRKKLEMKTQKNEIWSFIALCEADISLEGFKYPYNGKMTFNNPIGVSNVTIDNEIKIEVSSGEVIYFRWKKSPL